MLGEKMKIKDIEPGMSNITITARVTFSFKTKESFYKVWRNYGCASNDSR
jgi:hypothetical protein